MELEDIKSYLRIDGDEEDGLLRIMIDAGKEFIRSAVGEYDDTDSTAQVLLAAVVQNMYDNRELMQSEQQVKKRMAKLLSPSISITFVEKAASMIERGSRGIVALVLRDASIKGEPEVYTIRDVTGIPAGWSEANKQYVKGYTNADLKAYTNHELRTSTIFKQEYNTNKHLGEYTNRDLASYMEVALMTQRLGG